MNGEDGPGFPSRQLYAKASREGVAAVELYDIKPFPIHKIFYFSNKGKDGVWVMGPSQAAEAEAGDTGVAQASLKIFPLAESHGNIGTCGVKLPGEIFHHLGGSAHVAVRDNEKYFHDMPVTVPFYHAGGEPENRTLSGALAATRSPAGCA
jgi:hypothetical protein